MNGKTGERAVVLAVSFALFMAGVAALSMDRGTCRTLLLRGALAGLAVVAVRQTLEIRKRQ